MSTLTRPRAARRGPYARYEQCRKCPRDREILEWCKQHAEEKADELLSKFVRRRDGACAMCGEQKPWELQAAHIFRRGQYRRLRWQPLNLITLCSSCHYGFDNLDRKAGIVWLRDNRPGLLEQLEEMKDRLPLPDVAEIILTYRRSA